MKYYFSKKEKTSLIQLRNKLGIPVIINTPDLSAPSEEVIGAARPNSDNQA